MLSRYAGLLAAVVSVAPFAARPSLAQEAPPAPTTPPAPTSPAPTTPAPAPQNPPANLPVTTTPPAPATKRPNPTASTSLQLPPMPKPAPPVKLPANVAARVGGRDITRDEVLAMFDMQHGRPLIGQMVQLVAVEQEAKRLGVTVTPAELNAGITKTKQDIVSRMMQSGTPMTYEEFATQNGVTDAMMRYSVGSDLLRRKALEKTLSNGVAPLSGQYKLAHLLIATIPLSPAPGQAPPTPEEQAKLDAAAKTKIDGIYADIKAGKITFDDAAKTYSDDTSNKEKGGLLGWSRRGFFVPEFDAAAFAIPKKGDVVGPVKTNFGYHLIKLIEKGSEATPAEKVAYRKEQVDQNLANPQVMQQWMNGIVEKAKIVVNPAVRLVPTAVAPVVPMGGKPAVPVKPVKKVTKVTAR